MPLVNEFWCIGLRAKVPQSPGSNVFSWDFFSLFRVCLKLKASALLSYCPDSHWLDLFNRYTSWRNFQPLPSYRTIMFNDLDPIFVFFGRNRNVMINAQHIMDQTEASYRMWCKHWICDAFLHTSYCILTGKVVETLALSLSLIQETAEVTIFYITITSCSAV